MKMFLKLANSIVKRTRVYKELKDDIFFLNALIKLDGKPIKLVSGEEFYLPNVGEDKIQRDIYRKRDFTAKKELEFLDRFVPENACILDVGANIGNHAIYWASRRGARKIICFEPVSVNYESLVKNIGANGLGERIEAHQVALGQAEGKASIAHWDPSNSGATVLATDSSGDLKVQTLDDFVTAHNPGKVDVMKIDVEGFEAQVLEGARAFLSANKPTILIEIFSVNFPKVDQLLKSIGYQKKAKTGLWDYVYQAD
jgi:FkbM family methyltransferase